MVFSGNRNTDRRRRLAAEEIEEEEMDRLKPPLHNFDLPCLKWGNQKFLRCMKVDSNGDVDRKRKRLPESDGDGGVGSGYGGVVIGERRREVEVQRRFRSSDYKFSSSEKLKLKSKLNSKSTGGDGEIEATREKLMFDLRTEVDKMKDAMLRGSFADPVPATVTTPVPATETDRPWNLRTRRAACKAYSSSNGVNGNGDDLKPNSNYSPPARNSECEKLTERPKFSVSLSRREVKEDFTAMTGRRLPRKPKKRPRAIQKQLDTLFPGLWLTEITPDLYRVPDDIEPGKR